MVNIRKTFWVVAYDVTNNRRRSRIVKVIEKFGVRVNYSVFECMLTDGQLKKLQGKISKLMLPSKDKVIFYPLCLNCYSKIRYLDRKETKADVVTVI